MNFMKISKRLTILNRGKVNTSSQPYLLLVEFQKFFNDVRLVNIEDLTVVGNIVYHEGEPVIRETILIRVSENLYNHLKPLADLLEQSNIMVNSNLSCSVCANKLTTNKILEEQGLPTVPSVPAFAGQVLETGTVAKPVYGAGGWQTLVFLTLYR